MAHGDAREGKCRGNRRMEWVDSTLTLPRNVLYPALLTLMRTPRLSAVDWTDAPADLNGLVRFGERRNLVSARVPSCFKSSLDTADYPAGIRNGDLLNRGCCITAGLAWNFKQFNVALVHKEWCCWLRNLQQGYWNELWMCAWKCKRSCNVYELLTKPEARHHKGRRLGKSRSQLPLV